MDWKEFKGKYGHIKVSFTDYYKYVFSFDSVDSPNNSITLYFGADKDDIYRFYVDTKPLRIDELPLEPFRAKTRDEGQIDWDY